VPPRPTHQARAMLPAGHRDRPRLWLLCSCRVSITTRDLVQRQVKNKGGRRPVLYVRGPTLWGLTGPGTPARRTACAPKRHGHYPPSAWRATRTKHGRAHKTCPTWSRLKVLTCPRRRLQSSHGTFMVGAPNCLPEG